MNEKLINKAGELMSRVIKLNENAAPNVYYVFTFAGHTKQVELAKRRLPNYEAEYLFVSYLDSQDLSVELGDIETIIAAEEIKQRKGF